MIDKHPTFGVSTENPQEPRPLAIPTYKTKLTTLHNSTDVKIPLHETPGSFRARPRFPTHKTNSSLVRRI
ncbi:uncharacterized protein CCOS01_09689 [Colletotrichum costaricense]|uniref:Uncharacterized protein n=1 Tax=Colletotrichum costaricense TaxID=1209916 RepID=A0AAJ0DYF9_9PEZI|nr:uncharacterized protein CCOS01_09689 [Colletotrichum costaricense]KAK1521977.1 hypothetical protein CCOS01_09689 [Colletotrichum costaricense]